MNPEQLGKAAAKITSKRRSVKINKPGGSAKALQAMKERPKDGRQQPWTYGEKRLQRSQGSP